MFDAELFFYSKTLCVYYKQRVNSNLLHIDFLNIYNIGQMNKRKTLRIGFFDELKRNVMCVVQWLWINNMALYSNNKINKINSK